MSRSLKWCLGLFIIACQTEKPLPEGFVNLQEVSPEIEVELRYYSTNNFIGDTIDGYQAPILIVSKETAEALHVVQQQLKSNGFGLKLFDGYRPQRAVNQFVNWAKDLGDTLRKAQYYPDVKKDQLFALGYIASKSGHTRGSTVDLTVIQLDSGEELDMGSPYDLFDSISHHGAQGIYEEQAANRKLLKEAMESAGFKAYQYEWWHYTLSDEPYPNTYFDFVIQ